MALFWIVVGAWAGSITGHEWKGIALGIFLAFLTSGDYRREESSGARED